MHKLDEEIKRLHMIMPVTLMKKIETWRKREKGITTSEAIRRLIEHGLATTERKKRSAA